MNNSVPFYPGMTLLQYERSVIRQALNYFMNNKTQTAKALGISIRTLDAKIDQIKKEDDAIQKIVDEEKVKRDQFIHDSRFGKNAANA